MIKVLYSASLLVALNVRMITYFRGSPVGGVKTTMIVDPSLEDDPFVCSSHIFALSHGCSETTFGSPFPELSIMKFVIAFHFMVVFLCEFDS